MVIPVPQLSCESWLRDRHLISTYEALLHTWQAFRLAPSEILKYIEYYIFCVRSEIRIVILVSLAHLNIKYVEYLVLVVQRCGHT